MKYLILLAVLFVACSENGKPCMLREIPYSKQKEAAEYVKSLMATITVETRNKDEDWDEFVESAHNSAVGIYGENLNGTIVETRSTIGCDCEKARKAQ